MKNTYLTIIRIIIFYLFTTQTILAQAPNKLSYQSVIRNSKNELVKSTPVKSKITILQGSSSGTIIYGELHNKVTDQNGLLTLVIGKCRFCKSF